MFSAEGRHPCAKSASFFTMRLASRTEARGFLLPMELTQRTRFRLASRSMMCFLLSGSPSQSLLKHMMSLPSIIEIQVTPRVPPGTVPPPGAALSKKHATRSADCNLNLGSMLKGIQTQDGAPAVEGEFLIWYQNAH